MEMIQIDMPMPDNCMECRFNTSEFGYCNAMPIEFVGQVSDFEEDGKPEWCPLKAQEPRVMTWSDIIGAALECKPVYIEVKDSEYKERGDDRWAMLTQYKDSITNGMICAMSSYITNEVLFANWYNMTWRCWTSRPTDEQREKEPWG